MLQKKTQFLLTSIYNSTTGFSELHTWSQCMLHSIYYHQCWSATKHTEESQWSILLSCCMNNSYTTIRALGKKPRHVKQPHHTACAEIPAAPLSIWHHIASTDCVQCGA